MHQTYPVSIQELQRRFEQRQEVQYMIFQINPYLCHHPSLALQFTTDNHSLSKSHLKVIDLMMQFQNDFDSFKPFSWDYFLNLCKSCRKLMYYHVKMEMTWSTCNRCDCTSIQNKPSIHGSMLVIGTAKRMQQN